MNQRNDSRGNWRDPGPYRAEQPQRSRYRDSSEELFGRQSFGAPEDTHYYGTGAAGWGGPGFTGGAYAYGNGPRDQERPIESEEYSDESAVSYEQANRPAYRQGPGPRHGHYPVVRARNPYPQGPKGYQRSDERMQEDISERLMESHYIDCSDVSVDVRGGKVVLEGTVPARNMKHAIEDLVDACPGVQDIENRVRVAGAASQSQSLSQSPSTGGLQPSLQTGAAGSSSRQ